MDPEIVSRYFFTLYYNYDNENINFKPTEQLLAWQFINGYNIRDNTSLPECIIIKKKI